MGKEEEPVKFSLFTGPRIGELLAAKGAEDESPEGSAFLHVIEQEEGKRAKELHDLLESAPDPYRDLWENLGSLLSLTDRLGSCWWGCSGGKHTIEHMVAASAGNALAALRLLRVGYYDESLGLVRQIGERANLLQLFLFNDHSLEEWAEADEEARRQKFSAVKVRLSLEKLGLPAVVNQDHYRYLSGFGIHPSRTPQSFGENFPPTVGLIFKTRGFLIGLSQLAYAIAMVGGSGAALLGPKDQRIPMDRIVGLALELINRQKDLSKIIEDSLRESEAE
jgi:hypothetical protein